MRAGESPSPCICSLFIQPLHSAVCCCTAFCFQGSGHAWPRWVTCREEEGGAGARGGRGGVLLASPVCISTLHPGVSHKVLILCTEVKDAQDGCAWV
jgi:hypothetical protein